jgi:Na+/H+ antiporter NhaC
VAESRLSPEEPLQFHGGLAGAFAPLLLFALAVTCVTAAGMITIQAYFGPLVLIVGLMIMLAKDRRGACEAMLSGVADRTLAVMIFAFLGAGVLGQLLVASGVVKAVVWLGYLAGLQGAGFVVLSFVVAAIVSTSIGTSTGTCVTVVPILYPAGVVLGAHPGLVLGAIYSGARFGDNLAPISDTTVASAFTQGAEVGEVVRTRLKYALVAAAASIALYAVAGSLLGGGELEMGEQLAVPIEEYARPEALWMLLAPALTIYLCVRGRALIQAIWYGIFSAVALGLATGTLTLSGVYAIAPPKDVGGAITVGLNSMRDVIFLAIFIMGILGALRRAGALDALMRRLMRFATTVKRAELAIFSLVAFMCPLCAGNTPAMLFTGPVVKEIGERFQIHRTRRANLMDLSGNGVTENLPHINTILALAGVMIGSHEATGAPLVPLTTVGLLAFHPMMLTVVGLTSIATGWGSRTGEERP